MAYSPSKQNTPTPLMVTVCPGLKPCGVVVVMVVVHVVTAGGTTKAQPDSVAPPVPAAIFTWFSMNGCAPVIVPCTLLLKVIGRPVNTSRLAAAIEGAPRGSVLRCRKSAVRVDVSPTLSRFGLP